MCARDPFTAISSIMRENSDAVISLEFRRKHILKEFNVDILLIESPFQQAIASYYYWSKIALEKSNPEVVIRIEDDEETLYDHLSSYGYDIQFTKDLLPPKNINANKKWKGQVTPKPAINGSEWLMLNNKYKLMINELCDEFGYDLVFDKSLKKLLR